MASRTAEQELRILLGQMPVYENAVVLTQQIHYAIGKYPSLTRVMQLQLTRPGTQAMTGVICLIGMLPIKYQGNAFNFPVRIFFDYDYPNSPPLVYVYPSPGLHIRPTAEVSLLGYVKTPILITWRNNRKAPPGQHLLSALEDIVARFSQTPPLSTVSPYGRQDKENERLRADIQRDGTQPFAQRCGYYGRPVYLSARQQTGLPGRGTTYGVRTTPSTSLLSTTSHPPATTMPSVSTSDLHALRYLLANKLAQDVVMMRQNLKSAKQYLDKHRSEVVGMSGQMTRSVERLTEKKSVMIKAIEDAKKEKEIALAEKAAKEATDLSLSATSTHDNPREALFHELEKILSSSYDIDDKSKQILHYSATVHACNDTLTRLQGAIANRCLLLDEEGASAEKRDQCIMGGLGCVSRVSNSMYECTMAVRELVGKKMQQHLSSPPVPGRRAGTGGAAARSGSYYTPPGMSGPSSSHFVNPLISGGSTALPPQAKTQPVRDKPLIGWDFGF
eukprot:gnl/Carplike_NY0171/1214_a1636_959.p1 GENE.gnl/Carplike_NY0171/1214_a1636_959~~gnl/Carplike_NY0171/1214_a1636_959.p1  ORF type:complete len:503 (-),score=112.66 gnl/Carplike_NY0171/1214_a1636_959:793-2301(-)